MKTVIKKLIHSKHLLVTGGLMFTAFSVSGTELKNGDRLHYWETRSSKEKVQLDILRPRFY